MTSPLRQFEWFSMLQWFLDWYISFVCKLVACDGLDFPAECVHLFSSMLVGALQHQNCLADIDVPLHGNAGLSIC